MSASKPLVYLAGPYSDPDPAIIAARMGAFSGVHARLILEGVFSVSPLLNHFIAKKGDVPGDWTFWQGYSEALLSVADELRVIRLPGWETSAGVRGELAYARRIELPVTFTDAWSESDWRYAMAEQLNETVQGRAPGVLHCLRVVNACGGDAAKARAWLAAEALQ